jgi:hypothetical protein
MPRTVTNIFISYGRKDARELAVRLRDDLEAVGFSVWLDLENIPGGADWSQDIEEAIEHCHAALALLSPASYQSEWCRAEQMRALRKGKHLIPILAVAGAERPLYLEHRNYLDFSDLTTYDAMFRDLLSDLRAGEAFRQPDNSPDDSGSVDSPFKMARQRTRKSYRDEKRDAPSFRRFLKELRNDPWGARSWWPYFLFYFTDMHSLIDILKQNHLAAGDLYLHGSNQVSLYFRPRTPHVFHAEGFRPAQQVRDGYAPMPVYLLFDIGAVVCHPEARFSRGNPARADKTYSTAQFFRELPFDQIYHDSWFSADEKEEILHCREAQVIIPERLGLEALQLIWLRSAAEYDTLRHLMPPELWSRWYDKITPHTDYHLFNNKRPFVESVIMTDEHIRFQFNPPERPQDSGAFYAMVVIEYPDGQRIEWQDEAFHVDAAGALLLTLPPTDSDTYTVQLLLDGDLAYMGTHTPKALVTGSA